MRAELILKLLDSEGEPIPAAQLKCASWDFVIADDWVTNTPPQIRVSDGITVSGNEIHIPLTETNTEEMIMALGSAESKTFGCELVGFEVGEPRVICCSSTFPFEIAVVTPEPVRRRRSRTATIPLLRFGHFLPPSSKSSFPTMAANGMLFLQHGRSLTPMRRQVKPLLRPF